MSARKGSLSIVIPVWNEGENIKIILKALKDKADEIVVVYDFAGDTTVPAVEELALSNVHLIQNLKGKGVANAIKTGLEEAKNDYILILAADDLGPTVIIDDMRQLMDEGCDFISCTRYAYGGKRDQDSFLQRTLSKTANKLFKLFSGSVFSDMTTGFKMFKRSILKDLKLESDSVSWAIVFEMAIKAQGAGLKLGEVPVQSTDRKHGQSTFKPGPWIKEYLRCFMWGLTHLHHKKVNKPIVRIPKKLSQ